MYSGGGGVGGGGSSGALGRGKLGVGKLRGKGLAGWVGGGGGKRLGGKVGGKRVPMGARGLKKRDSPPAGVCMLEMSLCAWRS